MPEGELPQERAQRRGCVAPPEQRGHAAVVDHVEVLDRVRAGDHPRHDRADLPRRVGADRGADPDQPAQQRVQPACLRQAHHRHQSRARHQIRITEMRRVRDVLCNNRIYEVPFRLGFWKLR